MAARKNSKAARSQRSAQRARSGEKTRAVAPQDSPQIGLEELAAWQFHECWITEDWRAPGRAVTVLVARRSGLGEMAAASFLVDLGCLGMKDGFIFETDALEYREIRAARREAGPMVECEPGLALAVVLSAGAYGENLGFEPDAEALDALMIFAGLDPDECDEDVAVGGPDGRPLYVAGPDDDVPAVLATLDREVGEGGYDHVVGRERHPEQGVPESPEE